MEVDDNSSLIEQFRNISTEDTEFATKCRQLSADVLEGRLSVIELIEQLGPLLVNKSPEERAKGTLILSTVLENLPNDHLSTTQLNYISSFYADRLSDHHQVIPAVIKGLLPLAGFQHTPDGVAIQLLSTLFQNVPCQQQQQSDRYNIYRFLKTILDKRKDEVKAMGLDYVYGVISAMDSERDPRNLLFLFNWLPHFLPTVNLGHLTEEMFEVMACYFPVDFRAPSQDPNSISRETLASALSPCLCAVPAFSSFCIPLVLEKLDSDLQVAKLDSLDLLMQSCQTFTEEAFVQHSAELWSVLQKQIIDCKSEEIERRSLRALTSLIKKLSYGNNDTFRQTVKDITDTVKGNLRPDAKLFQPSAKILISVAQAAQKSATYVIKEVMPLLTNLYNITKTAIHQVVILKLLIDFVKIYLDLHETVNLEEVDDLKTVPALCLKATVHQEQAVVAAALQSFSILIKYLSSEIRNCLYDLMSRLLVCSQSREVRMSLLECLKAMAEVYSSDVLSLLQHVQVPNYEFLEVYLEAVAFVAPVRGLTKACLQIIVTYTFKDRRSSCIALKILKALLELGDHKMQLHLLEEEDIVNRLVDWFLQTDLDDVSPILSIIIGDLDGLSQANLINSQLEKIVPLFKTSKNEKIVFLLHGLLCRARTDIKIGCDFVDKLADVCLETEDIHTSEVAAQLLGNIVNKISDDMNVVNTLELIDVKCLKTLTNINDNEHRLKCVINIISFITKGLVMRNHRLGKVWTDKLLELTENNAQAAKGFQIVMDDCCDCFGTKSHCNRRLLYRQKFFTQVMTSINENCKVNNDNYLLIIGYLLQEAPKQVLQLELKKIINLVLVCLQRCEEAEILCAVLTTLLTLLKEKDPIAEEYLQEFLTHCLKLAKFKKAMNVRVLALKCIRLYNVYPVYKLVPLKNDVIFALAECVDDRKRLVRKEAVEARSAWYLIDSPI